MTKRIRDLIDNVRDYHLMLAERYSELIASHGQSEKTIRVMEFLRDSELNQAAMLNSQLEDSSFEKVLDTWVKERPPEPGPQLDKLINQQLPKTSHNEKTLMEACSKQHNFIEEFYQQLTNMLTPQSAIEYFDNLRTLENKQLKYKISKIMEFDNMT